MADNAVTFAIKLEAQLEDAARLGGVLKGVEASLYAIDTATKHTTDALATSFRQIQSGAGAFDSATKHLEASHVSAGEKARRMGEQAEEAHHKGGHAAHEHEEEWEGLGGEIEHAYGNLHRFLYFTGALAAYEIVEKLVDEVKELGSEILHAAAAE